MDYLITPQQTLAIARQAGLGEDNLSLSGMAVVTFSKSVLTRLTELCKLEDVEWLSARHHPYSPAELVQRGKYQGMEVMVLVPSMGASPLACVLEDLIAGGIQVVFLVCPAWSLGPPIAFGDLIIPTFSMGPDGTSIHYGNTDGYISADPRVVEALTTACRGYETKVHAGGNASCEALYRITEQMVADYRRQGCLCMENGEASTVFAVTRATGALGGVLFQPYIDLQEGWNPARLDETYQATCRVQAEVVLAAGLQLVK